MRAPLDAASRQNSLQIETRGGGPNSPTRLVSRVAILSRLFKKYDWIISQSYAPCNALPPLAAIKTDNIRMPA